MSIVKDLLYNKDNEHLDISRFCSLLAVLGFIGLSVYLTYTGNAPSLSEYGIGWGGVAAGSAGWIYMRQRIENGLDYRNQFENLGYNGGSYRGFGPDYGYSPEYQRYGGGQPRGWGSDPTGVGPPGNVRPGE